MPTNQRSAGYLIVSLSVVLLIIVALIKVSSDHREALICEAVHVTPSLNPSICPAHRSVVSWLTIAAFGVSFLFLGSGVYMISPTEAKKRQFKEIDTSSLDDEEKKVYEALKKGGGSAYQGDLIKGTSMSKVQISRVLDKMETKGILERRRRGMANIVFLK
ncbi:MAG: hypothetical protein HZB68_00515 [Candidatus Aenigmarchaeota archaeon]|nr:hypothetical protein [Candidatus Aenigmarchaeota archaeon]